MSDWIGWAKNTTRSIRVVRPCEKRVLLEIARCVDEDNDVFETRANQIIREFHDNA